VPAAPSAVTSTRSQSRQRQSPGPLTAIGVGLPRELAVAGAPQGARLGVVAGHRTGSEPRQNGPMSVVEIQRIPAADTYDLRARVLRDGDFAAAHVRDDDLAGAWHLGAWCSGTLAGVASFYPRPSPLATDVPAVQLRFMAVEPAMHGHGIGRELLDHVVRELREKNIRTLWANGRDTALGFYTRLGFTVVGDGFIHEPGLPHHLITLGLS